MPKISIIVPLYNSADYLHRCIESLINQTLKDIEIILVNDASPDNSLEIAREYELKDCRVKVIDSPVNIVASRNLGIKAAKGKYLGFVDADDWVDTDFYEKLYRAANDETIDVVIGRIKDVDEMGSYKEELSIPQNIVINSQKTKEFITMNGGRLFTNIWKSDLITDDVLFIKNNIYCDTIVYLWYLKAKSFAKVDDSYYNYFINTSSITHFRDNPRTFDRLSSSLEMLQRSKKMGLYKNYTEFIEYRYYVLYFKNSLIPFCVSFRTFQWDKIKEARNTVKSLDSLKYNKYFKNEPFSVHSFIAKVTLKSSFAGCILLYALNRIARVKYLLIK